MNREINGSIGMMKNSSPGGSAVDAPAGPPQRSMRRSALTAALIVNVALLIGTAVWFRITALDWLPGVNGDECWLGAQARRIAAGEAFALFTPDGKPLDPFHVGPLVMLLRFGRPAIWMLRIPALLAGLALLPLMHRFIRKAYGPATALVILVMLAADPTLIAYSRFGWEPSGSPLASFVVLYAAANWAPEGILLALVASCIVHPTNVFLAPIAGAIWALRRPSPHLGRLSGAAWRWGQRHRRWASAIIGGLVVAVIAFALVQGWHRLITWEKVQTRIDLAGIGKFSRDWIDLLGGTSVFVFIAGPIAPLPRAIAEAVFAAGALAVVVPGTRRVFQRGDRFGMGLAIGTVAAVASLYLIGGPKAIVPHFERYGLGLVVPALLLLAICLRALVSSPSKALRSTSSVRLLVLTSALGWLWLASMQSCYFDVFTRTGGQSHRTFRTANPEPKLRMVRMIMADARAQGRHAPVRVVAEDWWLGWALEYLGPPAPWLVVVHGNEFEPDDPGMIAELERGAYTVVFAGRGLDKAIRAHFPPDALQSWDIAGRDRQALIRIYRPRTGPGTTVQLVHRSF